MPCVFDDMPCVFDVTSDVFETRSTLGGANEVETLDTHLSSK